MVFQGDYLIIAFGKRKYFKEIHKKKKKVISTLLERKHNSEKTCWDILSQNTIQKMKTLF